MFHYKTAEFDTKTLNNSVCPDADSHAILRKLHDSFEMGDVWGKLYRKYRAAIFEYLIAGTQEPGYYVADTANRISSFMMDIMVAAKRSARIDDLVLLAMIEAKYMAAQHEKIRNFRQGVS
jgi:hypothetical protein